MHKALVVLTVVIPALTAVAVTAAATPSTTPGTAAAGPARTASAPLVTVRPDFIRLPMRASATPPSTAQCEKAYGIACYAPGQIQTAYSLPALYTRGATGKGTTIAIVDPFGSPTIKADLAAFDKAARIAAPPKFTVIAPAGKIPRFSPKNSAMVSWASETSLDVEYAHTVAPGANILLVETPASETEGAAGFPQIVKAEEYAMAHYKVGVISQSFATTEETFANYPQLNSLRGAYTDAQRRKVTVLAGSGDSGATNYKADGVHYYTSRVAAWPATDPLVTAVGGTQLVQSGGGYKSVAWNDSYNKTFLKYWTGSSASSPFASGGGVSKFFARPAYQRSVNVGTHRGVPDISMSAACDGAVQVYSSYTFKGWSLVCGTSEATPEFAGVVAIADQVAGHSLGVVNTTLYKLAAAHAPGIVDVTSGNNTVAFTSGKKQVTVKGRSAVSGYDLVTGVGTLNARQLTYELAGKG